MFESMAFVLYFAPSIINQIQLCNDDGLIVSRSKSENCSFIASLKLLIDKLFIPIGSELSTEYTRVRETQINEQYDDLSRAVKTVKEAQRELIGPEFKIDSDCIDVVSYVEGIFKITTQRSFIDNSLLICVRCPFGEYTICGITSLDKWVSKSLINQLIMHGEVAASAIVIPLSVKDKVIQVKIACIFVI